MKLSHMKTKKMRGGFSFFGLGKKYSLQDILNKPTIEEQVELMEKWNYKISDDDSKSVYIYANVEKLIKVAQRIINEKEHYNKANDSRRILCMTIVLLHRVNNKDSQFNIILSANKISLLLQMAQFLNYINLIKYDASKASKYHANIKKLMDAIDEGIKNAPDLYAAFKSEVQTYPLYRQDTIIGPSGNGITPLRSVQFMLKELADKSLSEFQQLHH